MIAQDPFSQHYSELLDGTYDVVDRLVLNAWFPLAMSPGGFRTWWRQLHDGSDDTLDNAHLMRAAGRFARRLRGWAHKHGIPVISCAAGERKHEVALKHLPADPHFRGVFAVLVARAPAPVWDVQRNERGGGGEHTPQAPTRRPGLRPEAVAPSAQSSDEASQPVTERNDASVTVTVTVTVTVHGPRSTVHGPRRRFTVAATEASRHFG
jgi:hypothetical protein